MGLHNDLRRRQARLLMLFSDELADGDEKVDTIEGTEHSMRRKRRCQGRAAERGVPVAPVDNPSPWQAAEAVLADLPIAKERRRQTHKGSLKAIRAV